MRYYVVITSSEEGKTVKLVTEKEKIGYKKQEDSKIFPYLSRWDRIKNLETGEMAYVKNVDYTREEVIVFYASKKEEATMELMGLLDEKTRFERRWPLNQVESCL